MTLKGAYSHLVFYPRQEKHMKKYIVLISLAILTMTCAVLEGLVPSLPPLFIQINGLLTILCAGVIIVGALKAKPRSYDKD